MEKSFNLDEIINVDLNQFHLEIILQIVVRSFLYEIPHFFRKSLILRVERVEMARKFKRFKNTSVFPGKIKL